MTNKEMNDWIERERLKIRNTHNKTLPILCFCLFTVLFILGIDIVMYSLFYKLDVFRWECTAYAEDGMRCIQYGLKGSE